MKTLNRTIRKLKRLYQWAKFVWSDDDYDSYSIYDLLEYKLKKLEYNMLNGYGDCAPEALKSIRIAIKLSGRLYSEYHSEKLFARHEKKWGELEMHSSPGSAKGYKQLHFTRKNIFREADYQLEKLEAKERFKRQEAWRDRDHKLLFDVMSKYMLTWWT